MPLGYRLARLIFLILLLYYYTILLGHGIFGLGLEQLLALIALISIAIDIAIGHWLPLIVWITITPYLVIPRIAGETILFSLILISMVLASLARPTIPVMAGEEALWLRIEGLLKLVRERYYAILVFLVLITVGIGLLLAYMLLDSSRYVRSFTILLLNTVPGRIIILSFASTVTMIFVYVLARLPLELSNDSTRLSKLAEELIASIHGFQYLLIGGLSYISLLSLWAEQGKSLLANPLASMFFIALISLTVWLIARKRPSLEKASIALLIVLATYMALYKPIGLVYSILGIGYDTPLDPSMAMLQDELIRLYDILVLTLKYIGFLG
ncbi:MAG: hypothetical protein ABWW69_06260 [Pyrodictiaceae archaeon]